MPEKGRIHPGFPREGRAGGAVVHADCQCVPGSAFQAMQGGARRCKAVQVLSKAGQGWGKAVDDYSRLWGVRIPRLVRRYPTCCYRGLEAPG
jgi:hypothetical protein